MTRIGIVGAGEMGAGIANLAALSGHDVVLIDVDEAALTRAMGRIKLERRMRRLQGVADEGPVGTIEPGTDLAAVGDCAVVVENVTENWLVKQDVHEELAKICPPATVIVANTSAIPITRIASVAAHPDRVVGVHFMNPVTRKSAVELIAGRETSDATLASTRAFLDTLGVRAIEVGDACGFVSNRVLMLTVNEAAALVEDGVAEPETVDDVFRSCFGHPMGPLETADLIGLDTVVYSLEVLHEHYADPKFLPCAQLRAMVDAGRYGRKTAHGFYRYDALRATTPTTEARPSDA